MLKIKNITVISLLTAILFIQEQILSLLPNIQLTFFLLVLYSKKLKFINTSIICFVYVLLDNLFIGNFNILFMIFMLIGLLTIPVLINTIFRKVESNVLLAFLGVVFSLIYSWILIIPGCIVFEMNYVTHLKADIVWEALLVLSTFLTILFLYDPCARIFDEYY